MSQTEFTIDGNTTLKIDTGNQAPGKFIVSDASGKLDWANASSVSSVDKWNYVSNVIPANGGAAVVNLSINTHHMVVNNQGGVNYATNKVRLVLPSAPNFSKVRITLMSEPWEVYVGSTEASVFFSSKEQYGNNTLSPRTRGPVSLATFTAANWFKLTPHGTIELTRFQHISAGSFFDPASRNYWIVTNGAGYGLSEKNIG